MKILVLLLGIVLLVGCSTTLTDAQVESMSKPTFEIDCPAGCSVAYTDPRDRMQLPTNGYDVANTALRSVTSIATTAVPWLTVGRIAAEGIKGAGDRNQTSDSSSRDNSVVDNTDNSVINDSTHTPTIFEQPAPTIVEQPAPLVVE